MTSLAQLLGDCDRVGVGGHGSEQVGGGGGGEQGDEWVMGDREGGIDWPDWCYTNNTNIDNNKG